MGMYSCGAKNEVGLGRYHKKIIELQVKPIKISIRRMIPPANKPIFLADTKPIHVTFECRAVGGVPRSNIAFYYKSKEYIGTRRIDDDGTSANFTLLVTWRDEGDTIECNAFNDENVYEPIVTSVSLKIKTPAVFKNYTIHGVISRKLTLHCDALVALPRILTRQWYKNNSTHVIGTGRNLKLNYIKKNDYGMYFCRAANSVGVSTLSIKVSPKNDEYAWMMTLNISHEIYEGDYSGILRTDIIMNGGETRISRFMNITIKYNVKTIIKKNEMEYTGDVKSIDGFVFHLFSGKPITIIKATLKRQHHHEKMSCDVNELYRSLHMHDNVNPLAEKNWGCNFNNSKWGTPIRDMLDVDYDIRHWYLNIQVGDEKNAGLSSPSGTKIILNMVFDTGNTKHDITDLVAHQAAFRGADIAFVEFTTRIKFTILHEFFIEILPKKCFELYIESMTVQDRESRADYLDCTVRQWIYSPTTEGFKEENGHLVVWKCGEEGVTPGATSTRTKDTPNCDSFSPSVWKWLSG